MPNFNGTGPLGQGPGSGWGRGPCGGGMARRRGWGRGWFGGFFGQPKMTEKEEAEMLSEEAKALEQELEEVKTRLSQLKGQK